MKNILCFGDSNTWGYDLKADSRYEKNIRWTGMLDVLLAGTAEVHEAGIPDMTFAWDCSDLPARNGLACVYAFLTAAMPVDLVIVTLGTNDTKEVYHASAEEIGEEARKLIRTLRSHEWAEVSGLKILVTAPVPLEQRAARVLEEAMNLRSVEVSRQLAEVLARVAEEENVFFCDASTWEIPLDEDGCHYTEEGHAQFARHMREEVEKLI